MYYVLYFLGIRIVLLGSLVFTYMYCDIRLAYYLLICILLLCYRSGNKCTM